MANLHLKIGILNLMHDKAATQRRFTSIFKKLDPTIEISFFYPVDHYRNRPVPKLVRQISEPLDLEKVRHLDGFIITGAPLDHLPFEQIEYYDEINQLIDTLVNIDIPQLYICWGAMIAANHLYGIEKRSLPQKYFGVFENLILNDTDVLNGFTDTFPAPHARYAELDHDQLKESTDLTVNAISTDGYLLSLTGTNNQDFLFAHLEYDRMALWAEYQREINTHPERYYALPKNYFKNDTLMLNPQFQWSAVQQRYFNNWLDKVTDNARSALTLQ